MRFLYIDVDSLRVAGLGCYGYHRNTSPTIDTLAKDGVRFEHCYVSDAPCLPSRSALALGRFGFKNGVVNHGGLVSEPFQLGTRRGFSGALGFETLFQAFRRADYFPVSITPFPNRHVAPWFTLGLREWFNTGKGGFELAHQVNAVAEPWLEANAAKDSWFLHVNYWDAHTPYRLPDELPNPFSDEPPPEWPTQEVLDEHWHSYGPNSAQDAPGVWTNQTARAGIPQQIKTRADFVAWINGYDQGVRYVDDHIAKLLAILGRKGVLEDTVVAVSADHGECQGEHNVYGDHQTACSHTSRVPFVVRGPGFRGGKVNHGLHYQFDLMATLLQHGGGKVPEMWDARPLPSLNAPGREHLVISQMAWTCQRSVRWGKHLLTRTYHDGYKDLPELALYDLEADPHATHNLADSEPGLVKDGLWRLEVWRDEMLKTTTAPEPIDPMYVVLREGGPWQVRGRLKGYVQHLRETGRGHHADALEFRHKGEL